jgi:hypothetical protein
LQVGSWYVHAPFSHPLWPCVVVIGLSLRDVPGWPPAKINLDGATHEVMVYALDPKQSIRLDRPPAYLTPCNFAGQFTADSDDAAAQRIELAVRDICAGELNPDSDGRHQWAARFSRSNFKPGADRPDLMAVGPSGLTVVGMGGANTRALGAILNTAKTLGADESKPQ